MMMYPQPVPLLLGLIASAAIKIQAFGPPASSSDQTSRRLQSQVSRQRDGLQQLQLRARESSDELLSLLSPNWDGAKDRTDEEGIQREIQSLESSFLLSEETDGDDNDDDPSRFDDLIGLYEVKSVLTKNKGENPVGGKWTRSNGLAQRLFRTRATFQHLLPVNATGLVLSSSRSSELGAADDASDADGGADSSPSRAVVVAEAVNVVSLDALDGLLRATIVLRGDAVPLSPSERSRMNSNRTLTPLTNLAVRAYFDPPRIFFGKRNKGKNSKGVGKKGEMDYSYLPLRLGPTSSVVLDTTYYDDAVRIGMGGTSGTRFVFATVTTTADDEKVVEAREYEALLALPYAKKWKVVGRLGGIAAASLYVASGMAGGALGKVLGPCASRLAGAMIANVVNAAAALDFVKRAMPVASMVVRIMASMTSILSMMAALLMLFSSGGIERDGVSTSQQSATPR